MISINMGLMKKSLHSTILTLISYNSPTAALNFNYDAADWPIRSSFMHSQGPCLRYFSKMTRNLPG